MRDFANQYGIMTKIKILYNVILYHVLDSSARGRKEKRGISLKSPKI